MEKGKIALKQNNYPQSIYFGDPLCHYRRGIRQNLRDFFDFFDLCDPAITLILLLESRELMVYAPADQQPTLGRTRDQLSEVNRTTELNVFCVC